MKKWNGFDTLEFEFEGKKAILVFPEQVDENRNWMLKTEYWDAFPEREIDLLNRGFHLAYLENETRFATKADCDRKARFIDYLSVKYGLRNKCVLVGMSCGGAHAVNFAGFYPKMVSCIFIDAPVLNFCDFPGRLNDADCEKVWKKEFEVAYPGITRAKLLNFDNHPIGKIDILKENNIPILMMYGTEDATVNYEMNGRLMEIEYKDNPLLCVMPRFLQGHHPHGYSFEPEKIIEFILDACRRD